MTTTAGSDGLLRVGLEFAVLIPDRERYGIDWCLASCSLEQGFSEFGLLGERKLLPPVNETIDYENERQPLVLGPLVSFSANFGEHSHRIKVGAVLVREPSICSPLT